MSISLYDNNADCAQFDDEHGIEFPTISAVEGNGDDICNAYNINAYPTYILIAPDHSIVEQDMWPISSAADFDPYFTSNGINESSCNTTNISKTTNNLEINIYPNPVKDIMNIDFDYTGDIIIKIYDIQGKQVYSTNKYVNYNTIFINMPELNSGIYTVSINTGNHIINKKINIL